MKELNIGKILMEYRKEKEMTQEEVALAAGVSKAAVSKWENGQSYPDITILPTLAALFRISIDELMGYQPQLSEKEIWEIYRKLAEQFQKTSFREVVRKIRELISRYGACYALYLPMAQLLLNHFMLAPTQEERFLALKEAQELCVQVRRESRDTMLKKDAISMEAFLSLIKKDPEHVLELLGEKLRPSLSSDIFLVGAYQQLGEKNRAMEYCQAILYQRLVEIVDLLLNYGELCREEKKAALFQVAEGLEQAFSLRSLLPHKMISLYMMEAVYYGGLQDREKTLKAVGRYVDTVWEHWKGFSIHGDEFFDFLDQWLKETHMNTRMPRNHICILEDMVRILQEHPALTFLGEDPEFKAMVLRITKVRDREVTEI